MKALDRRSHNKNTLMSLLGQNKGQLIVEFLLLVVIVTIAAVALSSALVSRADGDYGAIITKWNQLIEMIGQDMGD